MASVQSISESGIKAVPSQYIQPISTRPESSPFPPPSLPTFDLSSPSPSPSPLLLNDICTQWGAFHVTNHSVPLPLLHHIRRVSLSFFQNPSLPYKLQHSSDPSDPSSQGYATKMLENDHSVLDWRDFFNHHTLPLSRRDTSCWPDSPPDYKDVVVQYSEAMHGLAKRLMGLVGESRGLRRRLGRFTRMLRLVITRRVHSLSSRWGCRRIRILGRLRCLFRMMLGGSRF